MKVVDSRQNFVTSKYVHQIGTGFEHSSDQYKYILSQTDNSQRLT